MRMIPGSMAQTTRLFPNTRRSAVGRTRVALLLSATMLVSLSAQAQGAYAGTTARSARQQGLAQKISTALGQAFVPYGVDDVTSSNDIKKAEPKVEDLDRMLKDARGRFFDTDFAAASKAAYNGMERFEDDFAFTDKRDAWELYGELTFVRTMALQRLGENAKADRTLALLAAVYPTYVPDPGLVPPKVASRFDQVVGRLNKMGAVKLAIQSRPAGAVAIVDGKNVGITPLDVTDLLPGPHFVSVSLGPEHAHEKVVVRNGTGEVKFDIGDPRAGAARALTSALSRAQSPDAILDAAKGVDARAFAAVVLPAGADVELLVGRFDGNRLAAIAGTLVKDDLSDLSQAVERVARASIDGEGEVWLARQGESGVPENLRGKFLGTSVDTLGGGPVAGATEEGEFPVAILAIGGGVAAAVVAAAAVTGIVIYVVTYPSNPGGTDLLIDSSRLVTPVP